MQVRSLPRVIECRCSSKGACLMSDDFRDVDEMGAKSTPQQGFKPGPEVLPAGYLYDVQIISGGLATTTKGIVYRLGLRVTGGRYDGTEFERTSWLASQSNVDHFAADMVALGLADAGQWGKQGRRWSQDVQAASARLIGRRFRGFRKDTPNERK